MASQQTGLTEKPTESHGHTRIILCADDYGLSEGVSRAIEELAAAGRLSATSALVTAPDWVASAPRLRSQRGHLAIGLHLDLSLGPPLGPMPGLAPAGVYPSLGGLMMGTFFRSVDLDEVRSEIERQLDRFEQVLTFPPDHIDGHQHVHVLPGVRRTLLEAVSRRYRSRPPLIRNPTDLAVLDPVRRFARTKALGIRALALGLDRAARRRGLLTNRGFSGFSRFDLRDSYAEELRSILMHPGPRHIVMCHPGHPDDELARRDPVVGRRRMEYDVLLSDPQLPARLWRPSRNADGPPVDWSQVET
jgi:chitin disaccharide deacetylase